jgi:outer membrane protein TolC
MAMVRIGILTGVASMLTGMPVHAHAQVSLKTVVDLAQRNSTGVRAAAADVDKANAQLSETKDTVIPTVNVETGLPVFPEVGYTGSPPTIWSVTVQSLVYSIPQKRYFDAAGYGLRAAKARLQDACQQVALDASTAYVELDTVNQELADVQQEEQFSARLVEIELQRTEAGVDPLSEQLQARLTAAQIKLKRLHLETRAANLEKQLEALTGLPPGSIKVDHTSIPEIPQVHGDLAAREIEGVKASHLMATSKALQAKGDWETNYLPELRFSLDYLRVTTLLNSVNQYFKTDLPANNFASGISINLPLLDMGRRARARESAADALRSKIEAEQAEKQNDLAIADLSGSIREVDTQAEIASLKQQIASEQLKTVLTQLELGNGAGAGPGSPPQTSPKAEQLARIDERQKTEDALDAGFELAKARLALLRALGHMDDWLQELKSK